MEIPENLQPILWSKDVHELSLEEDKSYIIHQVLMYGSLADIKWLLDTYPPREVKRIFIEHPKKLYTPQAFNFVKNFILKIEDPSLKEKDYVKTLF